jgi:hypothetical protein
MIFATQDAVTLIVAAAENFAELEAFHATAARGAGLYTKLYQPTVTDMLLEPCFAGLRKPPCVFEFADPKALDRFVDGYAIRRVPGAVLRSMQQQMFAALADDPYFHDDGRLIEDIHGIAEHDPWDGRSEEEKQQDAEHKREAEAAKAAGKLSGDSFAPGGARENRPARDAATAQVTDVRLRRQADGTVEIDDVLAVKGLYDDNGKGVWRSLDPVPADAPGKAMAAAAPLYRFDLLGPVHGDVDDWLDLLGDLPRSATQAQRDWLIVDAGATADTTWFVLRDLPLAQRLVLLLRHGGVAAFTVSVVDRAGGVLGVLAEDAAVAQYITPDITPGGVVRIYHRLDVAGIDLTGVVALLRRASAVQQTDLLASIVAARGQLADRCWLACATQTGAQTLAGRITAEPAFGDAVVEVYAVNDRGERMVPKGIEVVADAAPVEPARPWNDGADRWAALDDVARHAKDMRIRGGEFLFCGSYLGAADGCIVHVTPRSHFNRTHVLWEAPLDAALLPPDLKRIGPATYRTRSRDWISLNQELSGRGMQESLGLQLYVNSLD